MDNDDLVTPCIQIVPIRERLAIHVCKDCVEVQAEQVLVELKMEHIEKHSPLCHTHIAKTCYLRARLPNAE